METKRLNVNLTDTAYEDLKTLAEENGMTLSEFIREAIGLQKWFVKTTSSGGKVMLVEKDGETKEVVSRVSR